jgi:3D (Asp-Asp-Asp) domain-containing protein
MQRHALPILILALAVALPARSSQTKTHHHVAAGTKTAPVIAAIPESTPKVLVGSKGTRLEAQDLVTTPSHAPVKVAAQAKKTPANSAKVAATPAIPAGLPAATAPVLQGRLARLTAYWTDEDYWTSQHMSSTGVHLHEGHCAVDPKLIPYGSVVQIPGMGNYVAVDTGSAVISRQAALGSAQNTVQRQALVVDLFFESEKEAQQFAAHMPAFVAVSWTKPLASADAPMDPKALPVTPARPMHIYELASAPAWDDSRLPLNFRTPSL